METQQSIAGWCWQTFGVPESVDVIVQRALKEAIEMEIANEDSNHHVVMAEAVDVVIILKHLAEYLGYDMDASIAAKMRINREMREWDCHGNGDGTHIPSENDGQDYCVPVHSSLRASSTERTSARLPNARNTP